MRNKKIVRLTESQLHNIIAESVYRMLQENEVDEAYNQLQYAHLAGQADGALNSFGGKIRGLFDKNWKKRKERQKDLFGRTVRGTQYNRHYMNNDDQGIGMFAYNRNPKYNSDSYRHEFDPDNKENPFVMQRTQGIVTGKGRPSVYGPQHGEVITPNDFQDLISDRLNNKEGYTEVDPKMAWLDTEISDYDRDRRFLDTNRELNSMYQNGRRNAMGKVKKGAKTDNGVSLYGTGTKNGLFKNKGLGNKLRFGYDK